MLPEVQYFADVFVDGAYATRFAEVMRTLSMRVDYDCVPKGPTLLIVGPDWMRHFRLNPLNFSWNSDRRAFIDALPASARADVLVIDGDEHPSWIPSRGHVSPADCLAKPSDAPCSGLRTHSQKSTVAARAMADRKTFGHRS